MSSVPDGGSPKIRYAWGGCDGVMGNIQCGNPSDSTFVGGNIRDTDSSVSPSADSSNYPLYDWGVAFEQPINIENPSSLVISGFSSSTTAISSEVSWWTNNNATSTFEYGTTTSYGISTTSDSFVKSHLFTLNNLSKNTTYHFKVSSKDSFGNFATSSDYTFITKSATEYLGILSNGQSNDVGSGAVGVISGTQPYNNVSLTGGPQSTSSPLVPLVENFVETSASGMANTLHAYDPLSRPVFVGIHGIAGIEYKWLTRLVGGGGAYGNGMLQASTTKSLVEANGDTFLPIGVTIIHGESDYVYYKSQSYEDKLVEWQGFYEEDMRTLSASTTLNFPMFVLQMNSGGTGELAVEQYNSHVDHPGKIILAGPAYQYARNTDNVHFNNISEKRIGEVFAKVINEVQIKGNTWNPLMPTAINSVGNIVTIDYHIPVGELAIDTTNVAQRSNYGFSFTQTGGSNITISSVQLINNNTQVQITLSGFPDGLNPKIRYAWGGCNGNNTNYTCGKPSDSTMVGGNIRDTDSSVSLSSDSTNYPLYDWGVAFEQPINVDNSSTLIITNITNSTTLDTGTVSWWTNNTASSTIDYGTTASYGLSSTSNSLVNSHSTILSGLSASTTYHYKISSTDNYGNFATSSDHTFITRANIVANAPTIGTATAGDGGAIINYTAPSSNNSPDILDYLITSSPGNITATTTSSSSAMIIGLTNGVAYTFTVKARNSAGYSASSSPSNSVTPVANPASANGLMIYGDSLTYDWHDYSWNTTNTFESTERAYAGMYSIKSVMDAYGGFNISYWPRLDVSSYESLHFSIYSPSALTVKTTMYDASSSPMIAVERSLSSGWNNITIAMSELNPEKKIVSGFSITNYSGSTNTYYLDDIKLIDTNSPFMSSITSVPTSITATINWVTNKPADSVIYYGTTTNYGNISTSSLLVDSHSINIINLATSTTYHYIIVSTDASNNTSTSSDQTFTTLSTGFNSTGISIKKIDYYLMGINYPWLNYGIDFGGDTAWGSNGVADNTTKVNSDLADMNSNGVDVVRWWMFSDGRSGITYNASGTPTGLAPGFFEDMDSAISIAKANNIYLVPSLFDFMYLFKPTSYNGVNMRGYSDVLRDPVKTNAMITNVINPIMQHYSSESHILAWEIFNEPEWAISDMPQPSVNPDSDPVTISQFYNFASKVSASVHQYTNAYVTLGSASLKWNRVWTNTFADEKSYSRLNLDFYQIHYYDWMDPYYINNDVDLGSTFLSPLKQNVADLGLDKPIVVGEISGAITADQLDTLLKNGYAGVWPWSYNTDINVDWDTFSTWKQDHLSISNVHDPTVLSIPDSPTNVTAIAGNKQATIGFGTPAFDGNSPILDYTVTSNPGNYYVTTASNLVVITGLTNGMPYTFTITARNAIGNSISSGASIAVTPYISTSTPTSGNSSSESSGGGNRGNGGTRTVIINSVATTTSINSGYYVFSSDLILGNNGLDVIQLQRRLTNDGFYSGPITGYFGPLTKKAVKAYQLKMGLPQVGMVGPLTREKLNGSDKLSIKAFVNLLISLGIIEPERVPLLKNFLAQ